MGGRIGLCSSCAYQKVISTTRGSTFSLCLRAKDDPRYAKYPRLPVVRCAGHVPREGGEGGEGGGGGGSGP